MASLLLTGLSRLLRALTRSHSPPEPPSSPLEPSSAPLEPSSAPLEPPSSPSPKTYEDVLTLALSPTHPLHARHNLPAGLLTTLLTPDSQLVNLSPGPFPPPTHSPVYNVDDLTRPAAISAALNGCVWDSRLVQAGFDWTARSVWFIPLDASLLAPDLLDRHFRMVATLSNPDSVTLVLFPARDVEISGFSLDCPFDDLESFMRLCGFAIDSVASLAELADGEVLAYDEYMCAMHVAVVRPVPRAPPPVVDSVSEITYTSNDISSQVASTEYDEYISSDRRVVRFELDVSTLPARLAEQGNEVVVIGSESCVGCWDPRHAKRMTGRLDVPGVLVADVSVSVFAGDLEYKYAVVSGDDVVEWETGWNRRFKEDGELVRDEWRCS